VGPVAQEHQDNGNIDLVGEGEQEVVQETDVSHQTLRTLFPLLELSDEVVTKFSKVKQVELQKMLEHAKFCVKSYITLKVCNYDSPLEDTLRVIGPKTADPEDVSKAHAKMWLYFQGNQSDSRSRCRRRPNDLF
jgi:hypothetical protein